MDGWQLLATAVTTPGNTTYAMGVPKEQAQAAQLQAPVQHLPHNNKYQPDTVYAAAAAVAPGMDTTRMPWASCCRRVGAAQAAGARSAAVLTTLHPPCRCRACRCTPPRPWARAPGGTQHSTQSAHAFEFEPCTRRAKPIQSSTRPATPCTHSVMLTVFDWFA